MTHYMNDVCFSNGHESNAASYPLQWHRGLAENMCDVHNKIRDKKCIIPVSDSTAVAAALVAQSQFQFAGFWHVANGERNASFTFHDLSDAVLETAAAFDIRDVVGDQVFGDLGYRVQILIVHVVFQYEQRARLDEQLTHQLPLRLFAAADRGGHCRRQSVGIIFGAVLFVELENRVRSTRNRANDRIEERAIRMRQNPLTRQVLIHQHMIGVRLVEQTCVK